MKRMEHNFKHFPPKHSISDSVRFYKMCFFVQMLNSIMCIRYVSGGNPWAIFIVKRMKEISRASGNTEYAMNTTFGLGVSINVLKII